MHWINFQDTNQDKMEHLIVVNIPYSKIITTILSQISARAIMFSNTKNVAWYTTEVSIIYYNLELTEELHFFSGD